MSAASATGYRGAASATGESSIAISAGFDGRAMGGDGCAICLINRDGDGQIRHVRATKIGDHGTRPGIWYRLNDQGEFEEVEL